MRTLVLFAKQPIAGTVKTRLAASWSPERAARLYECFLRDQFERFNNAGERRIVGFAPDDQAAHDWFASAAGNWDFWPQPETSLGGRMAECFERWCSGPDDRMVLIGSDSPNLPDRAFEQAWSLLEAHDVVLGPAADGGYWLVGLRGSAPHARAIFDDIDWSTSEVLRQTVNRVRSLNLTLALLPLWFDVDTEAEVATLKGLLAAETLLSATVTLPRTHQFLSEQTLQ
ncbi:MAG: TIGR04282 family arsenosugar biosynthesis glycosyltransferase [Planctomycetota bacterium]|jgi:rSAM/selenodomain-associated transferase 1